jgi:heat shock protein HtpX
MSLGVRAAIAVALLVSFFALALGAAFGLAWGGVELFSLLAHVRVWRGVLWIVLGALGCFAAAAVILWSILPRIDRFEPPGPELARGEAPGLFGLIDELSRATGQRRPEHVYLVDDVNAFVTERGGVMGFGARRVMGVGLPLLQLLDVSELRGVLAHEYGHYDGGDTRLGPWIYKTKSAIGRTIENLSRAAEATAEGEIEGLAWLLIGVRKPFLWFGMLFLRVTRAVSRAQELAADALAARVAGKQAMIRGLGKTHGGAAAFHAYLRTELAPVLAAGFSPPAAEGFTRFLRAPGTADRMDEVVAHELVDGEADPYDSHPSLPDRVNALRVLPVADVPADARPAVSLLGDVARLERRLAAEHHLPAITWDDVLEKVYLPGYRRRAYEICVAFAGVTPAALRRDAASLRALMRHALGAPAEADAADDDVRAWATDAAGTLLVLGLLARGFTATAHVGEPVRLTRGERVIDPFLEVGAYLRGETSPQAWVARLAEAGADDLDLGRPSASAVA